MKTDRELLELAARASGVDWFDEPAAVAGIGLHMKSGPFWNPLTDDGDALRLAVRLGMVIDARYTGPESMRYNSVAYWVAPSGGRHISFGDTEADFDAATRRAITRAAAAIGEGMK